MQYLVEQIPIELQHRNFGQVRILLREVDILQKRFPHLFSYSFDQWQKECNLGEISLQNYTQAQEWWRQGKKEQALQCLAQIPSESFLFEVAEQFKQNIISASQK